MRRIVAIGASAVLTSMLLAGTVMAQSVSGSATISGSTGTQSEGQVLKRHTREGGASVGVERRERTGVNAGVQSRSENSGSLSVRTRTRSVEEPSVEVRRRSVTEVQDEPTTVIRRKKIVRHSSAPSRVVVVRHKHRRHYAEEPTFVVKHKHRVVRYQDEPSYSVTRRTRSVEHRYESEPSSSVSIRTHESRGGDVQMRRSRTEVSGSVSTNRTSEPQGTMTGKARGSFGAEGQIGKHKIQGGASSTSE